MSFISKLRYKRNRYESHTLTSVSTTFIHLTHLVRYCTSVIKQGKHILASYGNSNWSRWRQAIWGHSCRICLVLKRCHIITDWVIGENTWEKRYLVCNVRIVVGASYAPRRVLNASFCRRMRNTRESVAVTRLSIGMQYQILVITIRCFQTSVACHTPRFGIEIYLIQKLVSQHIISYHIMSCGGVKLQSWYTNINSNKIWHESINQSMNLSMN